MTTVAELTSQNVSQIVSDRQTWSIFYNVKEQGCIGNGSTDDGPALNTLFNSTITGPATVIFPAGDYLINSNLTIPKNVFLYFVGSSYLHPASGVTLTINCGIIAGPYQIFTGAGSTVGTPICERLLPQWWGAKGDNVADDSTAITKTRALAPAGSTIFFMNGTYLVNSSTLLTPPAGVLYRGEGNTAQLKLSGTNYPIPSNAVIASLGPNKAVVTDGSGAIGTSATTTAEMGYLTGLTGPIQTQLDAKPSVSFSTISVPSQGGIVADSASDTLTIEGGTGITVSTDPTTDKVVITATGTATPGPHAYSHITGGADVIPIAVSGGNSGLMSGLDKAKLEQTNRPVTFTNMDDFSVDNSLYENASNIVDSTVSMDTVNKKLSVIYGADFRISYKSHKVITNGKNVMINTVFQAASQFPQIGLRINGKDTVGAYVWYQQTNLAELKLLEITNAGTSVLLIIPFDGPGTTDLDVSVRTFNEMTECFVRQNGVVIGSGRYINAAINSLPGIANGLGAFGTAVYKKYLKGMELRDYINIICLGDSNTLGSGLTTKSTYPAMLQSRFFEKNVGAINKGVSGNKVADVVARLNTDVYDQKVTGARNIVVLQIGTNDATVGTTASAIYNAIVNNLIIPMKQQGFEVWLSTIPTRDDILAARTIVKAVNALILADTNANKIIDLYGRLVDTTDVTITGILQVDNLHLTEKGTNIFAGLVANELGT